MTNDTNDTNDINDDDIAGVEDASFDSFEKQGSLGDLIRNNPAAKIGVVLVGAALIFGVIALMGGGGESPKEQQEPSMHAAGSEVKGVPGGKDVTPAYQEAIREKNEEQIEVARQTGDSALPVLLDTQKEAITLKEEEEEQEDPLQRWRRLQEERLEREIRQQKELVQPDEMQQNDQHAQAVKQMEEGLKTQMTAILQKTTEDVPFEYKGVTAADWYEGYVKQKQSDMDGETAEGESEFTAEDEGALEKIIIPAGEIEYAQLITEANSDVPGPVIAMVASGPLRGSKIIGSFQKLDEMLSLTFDTAVVDGVSYSIDAIALDPETTLPGMATDVNHHYFRRIVMPMAAAFVEGLAEATSETASVVVVTDGGAALENTEEPQEEEKVAMGLDKAGEKLGEILDEEGDVEVTVRVEAGTPIGVLFLEPVKEATEETASE